MAKLKKCDLFISHAWNYNEGYDRLVQMLSNTSDLKVIIHSAYKYDTLDPNNPEDRKPLIKLMEKQIIPAGCIVVLLQMYSGYKEWLQAVFDIAQRYKKPIIGIKPIYSLPEALVPTELEKSFTAMVTWNKESIVKLISTYSE